MTIALKPSQGLDLLHDITLAMVRETKPDGLADFTHRQLAILLTVYLERPPHTVRGLARKLGVTKPVITRALDDPLIWTDEMARLLLVWVAALGWMLATRRRGRWLATAAFRGSCRPPTWPIARSWKSSGPAKRAARRPRRSKSKPAKSLA
jgi:hypothetical protein